MLSSWGRYWYIVELPSSLDSRDSRSHSWSEALMLTEDFGTQSSRTWQLVYLDVEIWNSSIQLFGTLIPIVLLSHSGFGMMHARLH